MIEKEDIIRILRTEYSDVYLPKDKLPDPYVEDINNVRAIILGCDPSNNSGDVFNSVFGLDQGLKYFRGINSNVKRIGLDKSKIYVDNVCKNYFKKETYDNKKKWVEVANRLWIENLKDELNRVLPIDVPVLVTSEIILQVLCYAGVHIKSMNENYYRECIYISETENKLGRIIIPFFRHYKYSLDKWDNYKELIKNIIQKVI
jgi:hypothetical protein